MKSLKFISLVLFSLVSTQVFSQLVETDQAKLIVEGEVTSISSKWNENKTHIITESFVKIKSVFKGELRDSIIRIETFGGEVDGSFHYSPHTIQMYKGSKGYFFLNDGYEFISYLGGFAHINDDLNKKVRHNGRIINQNKFENEIVKTTKFPKISTSEYYALFKQKGERDRDTCNIISSVRTSKSINFSFRNVKYTSNLQYLEFDINTRVNTPGLKFGKGNLYIKYSSQFGTNAISQNTVEITKGAMLQDTIYNLSSIDYNAQTIKVSILPQYGSNTLYTFSDSEEQLVHFKVKIADFSSIGSISFDDVGISGEVFYWCQGSYGLFDETNLSKPINATDGTPGNSLGLTYTFENATYSSVSNKFVVDIFAKATANSKYSDGSILINYNDLGFGKSVVKNSTLTFKQLDLLAKPSYFVHTEDVDENTLSLNVFNFGTDSNDYNELGTIPQKLGTLTFNVLNCEEQKNINFDQTTETSDHLHYTGKMPIPKELYSPVIADDQETGTICGCKKPTITSFSPSLIHGGIGEELTISGQNFGTFVPTTSTVLFKNGDGSGPDEIEAGATDFMWNNISNWSDTEIKIKVPGCDKNKGSAYPPATGKFRVKNVCDVSDESSTKLDIPYSIFNNRSKPHGKAIRIGLQPNTVCFSFSNQVPNWIRTQFEIALGDWCNQTGISLKLGPTTTNNTPTGALDGTNLVSFGSGSGGGMISSLVYFENSNCFSEIDFVLRTTTTNPTTSDEENMRQIIKHELGHVHMLNHAKGLGQLMHPNGNTGGIITSYDQDGANLIFAASTVCGGIGKGGCGGSCSTTSIHADHTDNLQIIPNPVSNILNLISTEESISQVEILNNQGTSLKIFANLKSENALNISDLPAGFYICRVTSKGGIVNKMFVKI